MTERTDTGQQEGLTGQASAKVDPELRLICTQLYNDAMAELQEESGQRLFPISERLNGMNVQNVYKYVTERQGAK